MSARRRVNAAACASLLTVALASAPVGARSPLAAQGPLATSPSRPAKSRGPEVSYTAWLDLTVTGVAMTWWLGSELARGELAPDACRWCDPPGFDTSVRNQLRWQNAGVADTASYVLAIAQPVMIFTLDVIAGGKDGAPGDAWVDALLISQAAAVAMALNQLAKFAAGRERPFVHALPDADKPFTSRPSDNNLSFYSAHTSLTFALAASGGTIASMRRYRLAPWIWTAGIAMATVTGYLRIAADRHYASDVVVGAIVGTLTGAAVPYFFHGPREVSRQVSIAPAPTAGGLSVMVHGVF
jgi:membrane-associated phospholipid phosphatase